MKRRILKKILLLDANNLIYRARYSAKFAREGDAAIVYSFFRSLKPILEKFKPDLCYFVRDGSRAGRNDLLPEYKQNRKYEHDESFLKQKKMIETMINDYFPIILCRDRNLEADDLIGYLVMDKHFEDECVVVSSDTDFIQLLQTHKNCLLYNPITKKNRENPSYDYITWKSLRGDGADNIPGIPRVGDKTAEKLSVDPKKLDSFLAESSERMEIFLRNKQLITFKSPEKEEDIFFSENFLSEDIIKNIFENLNFNSMVKESYWNKYVSAMESLNEENAR